MPQHDPSSRPPSGGRAPSPALAPGDSPPSPALPPGDSPPGPTLADGSSPPGRTSTSLVFGLVAAAVLVTLVTALGLGALFEAPPATTPGPTIVRKPNPPSAALIRQLAELAAVEYHVASVIDQKEIKPGWLKGWGEAEEHLLFVAYGEVRAGVDLTELREGDIAVTTLPPIAEGTTERRRVRLVLPPPKVLSVRLDNQKSYVAHRKNDAWVSDNSPTLESAARQAGEAELEKAALDGEIMTQARRNTRVLLEGLLRGLEFDEVEVVFRDEALGRERGAPAASK